MNIRPIWNASGASLSILSALLLTSPVHAQNSDTELSRGLEDIVVTAQRREQQLQSTPLAVTAVTENQLQTKGISSISQLTSIAPGLQVTLQRNTLTPYMRGVGSVVAGPGDEGSVAMYLDGVYYASMAGANISLANIQRIEVLRGPQGTLFGRNATGGLIHIITRDPSFTPAANINLSYANYETATASLYMTSSLASKIAGDISVYLSNQGKGWGRNITLGEDVNLRRDEAYRGRLLYDFNDIWKAMLTFDYMNIEADQGNTRNAIPGSRLVDGQSIRGSIYDTRSNLPRDVSNKQWGANLRLEGELGGADIKSITAYRRYNISSAFDQDGTALPTVNSRLTEKTQTLQQEFIVNGDIGRLGYTAGVFYFYSKAGFQPQLVLSGTTAPNNFALFSNQITHSYAGFLQGIYHLTDETGLTLGARYTSDKREISGERIALPGHPTPGVTLATTATLPQNQTHRTFNKLTWRIALEQKFTPDLLGYASFSRGFKSGIFSTSNPFQPAINPEVLDAIAVGFKSEWFSNVLRFNAELFHYDYKDLQLTIVQNGIASQINAAGAKIKGGEVEFAFAPPISIGRLELSGNLSFLDTKYSSFPNAPAFLPWPSMSVPAGFSCPTRPAVIPAGGNRQCAFNATGGKLTKAPEFSGTFTAQYAVPLTETNELSFNITWTHSASFSWEPQSRVREPAYDLLSAQISIGAIDERWRVRVFGNNLTNEQYYSSVSVGTIGDLAAPGAPRTYGVGLAYKF